MPSENFQSLALMDSCSGSSLPQSILAQSPSVMSEDNTLAKEMMGAENAHVLQTSASFTDGMTADNDNKDCEVTEVTVVAPEPTMILSTHQQHLQRQEPQEEDNNNNVADDLEDEGVEEQEGAEEEEGSSESDEGIEDDALLETKNAALLYDNAKLKLLAEEDDGNAKQGIKVSGTLKLRSRDPLVDYSDRDRLQDQASVGCFPNCVLTVWGNLFD